MRFDATTHSTSSLLFTQPTNGVPFPAPQSVPRGLLATQSTSAGDSRRARSALPSWGGKRGGVLGENRGVIAQERNSAPSVSVGADIFTRRELAPAATHRLAAPVIVDGNRTCVFAELPAHIRLTDVHVQDVLAVPETVSSIFGASLIVAIGGASFGCLARVHVSTSDPTFEAFRAGRFTIVLVKGPAQHVAFEISNDHPDAKAYWKERFEFTSGHVAALPDDKAHFWFTAGQVRELVGNLRLSDSDRLSFGWASTLSRRAALLLRQLGMIEKLLPIAWPAPERVPEDLRTLVDLFRGQAVPSLVNVVEAVSAYSTNPAERVDRAIQFGGYINDLFGLRHPLNAIGILAEHVWELSSIQTDCGRSLPTFSGESIDKKPIDFASFPAASPIEEYWDRLVFLPSRGSPCVASGDFPMDLRANAPAWSALPVAEDVDATLNAVDALLDEAVANSQWTVPPDARVEIPYGPFASIDIRQSGDFFDFVLRTESGESASCAIDVSERQAYWDNFGDRLVRPLDATHALGVRAGLQLMLAALIRDFLVVEERESVFDHRTRPGGVRLRNGKTTEPRVVYLPRTRYVRKLDVSRCVRDLALQTGGRRAHGVRAHLRRCAAPSGSQLFLARRYGVAVPEGHTFVRPHDRGAATIRDVIYRSRSAMRCLFEADASAAAQPAAGPRSVAPWFRFERDVSVLMKALGFDVAHVGAAQRGDRGVDVFATRGRDLDEVSWVIQCKCYASKTKIGPAIVRELVGALEDFPRATRGMIVTTSDFSSEAIELAKQHGVRLMNGDEFAARLK